MDNYTKMVTPLAKAKNLGSGGGAHHWWMQRMTAIILVPLILWAIYFAYSVAGHSAESVLNELKKPYNLVSAMLLILTGLYHGALGMQVVIEDYVSCLKSRYFLIISLKIFTLVTIAASLVSLFSLLK